MTAESIPSQAGGSRPGCAAAGESAPKLLEFDGSLHIAPHDWRWIIPLIFLLPAALITGAILREFVFTAIGTMAALAGIWMYACHLKSSRDVSRLAKLLDDEAVATCEIVIHRGTPLYKAIDDLAGWLQYLARALAGHRLAGYVFSVGNAQDLKRDPIEPLSVPFEPVLLDSTDVAFRELASCGADPKAMKSAARRRLGWGNLSRQTRPMVVATGLAALAVHGFTNWGQTSGGFRQNFAGFGMSSLMLVLFLVQTLMWSPGGHLGYGLFFLFQACVDLLLFGLGRYICLAGITGWAALMAAWWYVRRSPAKGVWLFPGGLLMRGRREVYRRESALLIWYGQQRLCLIDAASNRYCFLDINRDEARLAVRAWLSPVPSPSDDMVAAFLGPA